MSENFDNELLPDEQLSERAQKALDSTRGKIRQRTIDRGIVQFRADEQFMKLLLEVAEEKKIPPGVLCREWVWQRLQEEKGTEPPAQLAWTTKYQPVYIPPHGAVLNQKNSIVARNISVPKQSPFFDTTETAAANSQMRLYQSVPEPWTFGNSVLAATVTQQFSWFREHIANIESELKQLRKSPNDKTVNK